MTMRSTLVERRRLAIAAEVALTGGTPPSEYVTDTVHRDITAAIAAHDRAAAAEALTKHFNQWRRLVGDPSQE